METLKTAYNLLKEIFENGVETNRKQKYASVIVQDGKDIFGYHSDYKDFWAAKILWNSTEIPGGWACIGSVTNIQQCFDQTFSYGENEDKTEAISKWISSFLAEHIAESLNGIRYKRPADYVFHLLKANDLQKSKEYAQQVKCKFHCFDDGNQSNSRIFTYRWVLDTDSVNGSMLWIRPQNSPHDFWLRYNREKDMLEYQRENEWRYRPFDS